MGSFIGANDLLLEQIFNAGSKFSLDMFSIISNYVHFLMLVQFF